ncbi:2-phospho-L-lactate guanylyltransferase, partial [Arthrobacter sp. I2-34]
MTRTPRPGRAPAGPAAGTPHPSWTVVIPFKGGPGAKSRLARPAGGAAGFRPDVRRALALAFLTDTAAAAAAVPAVGRIIVVSSDPAVLGVPGIVLVADPGHGLNPAITAGIDWAREHHPADALAVLAGDLPSLAPADLAAALTAAAAHPRALVPDRAGTGTTLATALPGQELIPRFGPGSCQAHRAAGHVLLPVAAGSTLRADVDTPEDLEQALHQGTGRYTRAAVLAPPPRAYGTRPAGSRRHL